MCKFGYKDDISLIDLAACHYDYLKNQTTLENVEYDLCSNNVLTYNYVNMLTFGVYDKSCYN